MVPPSRLSFPTQAEEDSKQFLYAVADEMAASFIFIKKFVSNVYDHSGLLEDSLIEILFPQ